MGGAQMGARNISPEISRPIVRFPRITNEKDMGIMASQTESSRKARPPGRKMKLDRLDVRLLELLQQHGRMRNIELARALGLSAAPCLRRMRLLEQGGYIQGYHADLNAAQLGLTVTVFAMVGLHSQAEADLQAFEARVQEWPMVRECYMLNGEIDFILKCLAPDLVSFQTFLTEKLTPAPNVAHVRTSLTIRSAKQALGAPLSLLAETP